MALPELDSSVGHSFGLEFDGDVPTILALRSVLTCVSPVHHSAR
jgi:hypothetical protein